MSLGEGFGIGGGGSSAGVVITRDSLAQTLAGLYAPASVAVRPLEPLFGDAITPGVVGLSHGIRFHEAGTIAQLIGAWEVPANGTASWTAELLPGGGIAGKSTVGTVATSAAFQRVSAPVSCNTPVAAGDVLMHHEAGGTASFLGIGFRLIVVMESGATYTLPAALAGSPDATALYSSGAGTAAVSWPAVPGAYSYQLWKSGTYLFETADTSVTVSAAAGDTFQVQALAPFTDGPMALPVPASVQWTGFGTASGTPVAGLGSPVVGSSTAPAPTYTLTAGDLHLTTGAAGGSSNNDAIGLPVTLDGATHQLGDVACLLAFDATTASTGPGTVDLNWSADALAAGFPTTHLIQAEASNYSLRGGYKSTTGTGSGTFQPALPSSPWPGFGQAVNDGATLYGVRMTVRNPGDGTRQVNIYGGHASAFPSALPLWGSFTVPAAAVSGLAAGNLWLKLNGGATAGVTYGVHVQELTVTYSPVAGT